MKTQLMEIAIQRIRFDGIKGRWGVPLLKAAQTPEWAKAKTMSRAATISMTLALFIKKGKTGELWPFGS